MGKAWNQHYRDKCNIFKNDTFVIHPQNTTIAKYLT